MRFGLGASVWHNEPRARWKPAAAPDAGELEHLGSAPASINPVRLPLHQMRLGILRLSQVDPMERLVSGINGWACS